MVKELDHLVVKEEVLVGIQPPLIKATRREVAITDDDFEALGAHAK